MKCAWTAVLVLCCEHSALGYKTELEHENNDRAHPLSLPPVPAMQNAGTDGLPEMPMVQALASDFLKAESNANSETKTFIGKLQKIGKNEVEKLQHLKTAYDSKLKSQERENQQMVKTNAGLAKETIAQNRVIDRHKVLIKQLDLQIKTRRHQMQVMEQRFVDGRQFMKDALATTDDIKEMSLLAVEKNSKSHEQGESGEESPVSFLERDSEQSIHHKASAKRIEEDTSDQGIIAEGVDLSASEQEVVPEVAPEPAKTEVAKGTDDSTEDEAMVKMLKDSLHKLRDGSKTSEEAMKAKFQEDFKLGAARQKALRAQQSMLQTTLKALKEKRSSLQQAAATLKARLASLEKNLQRGSAFVGHLSKVASARIDEVPETLKDFAPLPSSDVRRPTAAQFDSGSATDTASVDSA